MGRKENTTYYSKDSIESQNSLLASPYPSSKKKLFCLNNCGFFANNDNFSGYCSKCFQMFKEILNVNKNEIEKENTKNEKKNEKKEGEGKECISCGKKLKLMMRIKCKCGKVFCDNHKMPRKHECDYDFLGKKIKNVEENNPEIKPNL